MPHLAFSLAAVTVGALAAESEPAIPQPAAKPAPLARAARTVSSEQTAIAKATGEYMPHSTKEITEPSRLSIRRMPTRWTVTETSSSPAAPRSQPAQRLFRCEQRGRDRASDQLGQAARSRRRPGKRRGGRDAARRKATASNYLAIHVRREGKWRIAHLTESVAPAEPSPSGRLQELEWMVGSWKDNTSDAEVHTTCKWATNKTF